MDKSTLLSVATLGLLLSAQNGFSAETKAADAKAEAAKTPAKAEAAMGECHGVNSCKGQGKCGGQGHECAGSNTCKGQGFLEMTEKSCTAKKGKWQTAGTAMKAVEEKKQETPKAEETKKH